MTEFCYPCSDPDPRSCRQSDHPTRHSIAVRSTTASTFSATRKVPLASLISSDPTVDGEDSYQLARIRSMRGLTELQAGVRQPSFVILLAPVKNQIGVRGMPPRHALPAPRLLTSLRRFVASLRPIAAVSPFALGVSSRMACSDVSIYSPCKLIDVPTSAASLFILRSSRRFMPVAYGKPQPVSLKIMGS
jgi:hypothetical protein